MVFAQHRQPTRARPAHHIHVSVEVIGVCTLLCRSAGCCFNFTSAIALGNIGRRWLHRDFVHCNVAPGVHTSPAFGEAGVGIGLRIPGAFRNVAFVRNDMPASAVLAGAALCDDLGSVPTSAVCLCVFGSCRMYSHCPVLIGTLHKFHLNLPVLSFVPLNSPTMDSVRALAVCGHGLVHPSEIGFLRAFVLLRVLFITGFAQPYMAQLYVYFMSFVAAGSRKNAASTHSV